MTTATGDYAIDWSGVSDVNPYTNAGWTAEGPGGFTIQSGSLRPIAADGRNFFAYTGAAVSGDVYSAKMEVNHASASGLDQNGPAILDTSGNGYCVEVNGVNTRLRKVVAYNTSGIAYDDVAYVSGDVFEITVDVSDGSVEAFKNGVGFSAATDTTYDTGLRPGIWMLFNNSNAHGAISFAADNVVAASATTIADIEWGTGAKEMRDATGAAEFTPIAGIPGTPTISAVGATAQQQQVEVSDGTNTSAIDIVVSLEAGYQCLRAMDATSNKVSDRSLFSPDRVTVTDHHEIQIPLAVDGVTLNLAADGTVTVDATEMAQAGGTITFDSIDYSPLTGQQSKTSITFNAPVTNTGPTLPANETVNVVEGTTAVNNVSTATGTATIVYSLQTPADALMFNINSSTGELTFKVAPDYEGATNYTPEITATNDFGSAVQTVTITITNVLEQSISDGGNLVETYGEDTAGLSKTDALITDWLALFDSDSSDSGSLPATLTAAGSPYTITFIKADAPNLQRTVTVSEDNLSPIISGGSILNVPVETAFQYDYTITNMGGELPTLGGADVLLFSWLGQGGGVYRLSLLTDPTESDIGNTYNATITADDTFNAAVTLAVAISVVAASNAGEQGLFVEIATTPIGPSFLNPIL